MIGVTPTIPAAVGRAVCIAVGFLVISTMSGAAPATADAPTAPDTAAGTAAHALDPLRVTATPIIEGNEVDRYAGQSTLVTDQQIRDLNAQELAAALRRTPGVTISRYNLLGSFGGAEGGGLFLRGMGTSRPGAGITTLVDGVPMFMSIWNHPLLDLLPVDGAGTIEVHKSPQPHRFGNAFGAIDIVPGRRQIEGTETRLDLIGGSHGTIVGSAVHAGRQGELDWSLGGAYRSSDGHRPAADGTLRNLHGRAGQALSRHWDLSLFTLLSDNDVGDPGAEGVPTEAREGRYQTEAWLATVTLANRYATTDGQIKLYRNTGRGAWVDKPSGSGVLESSYYDFTFHGVKAWQAWRPWRDGELRLGLDWDVTQGDYDQEFSDGERDSWQGHEAELVSTSLAISHVWRTAGGLAVVPSLGARFHEHSDFPSRWAPHAGVVVEHGRSSLHARYAHGVLYPGLEVVVFSEKIIPALGESWRQLRPETLDHVEFGLRRESGDRTLLDLTWFHGEGRDRYVIVPPPPPPPAYANIGAYRIRGLEAAFSADPSAVLSVFMGVTYLDTRPSSLPYSPSLAVSGGLNWRAASTLTLSADLQYVGAMTVGPRARREGAENLDGVDAHFLANAKLSRQLGSGQAGRRAEIFVAAENLTGARYAYRPGYRMPGRTAMFGAGLRF